MEEGWFWCACLAPSPFFIAAVFCLRAEELKELPYFADLNWDDVAEKKVSVNSFL